MLSTHQAVLACRNTLPREQVPVKRGGVRGIAARGRLHLDAVKAWCGETFWLSIDYGLIWYIAGLFFGMICFLQ